MSGCTNTNQWNREQTHEMIEDVIVYLLRSDDKQRNCIPRSSNLIFDKLTRACTVYLSHHDEELTTSIKTLDTTDLKVHDTYQSVMSSLFEDKINYGRIIAGICFSKKLIDRMNDKKRHALKESIIGWLSTFVNNNLADWIMQNGHWVFKRVFMK